MYTIYNKALWEKPAHASLDGSAARGAPLKCRRNVTLPLRNPALVLKFPRLLSKVPQRTWGTVLKPRGCDKNYRQFFAQWKSAVKELTTFRSEIAGFCFSLAPKNLHRKLSVDKPATDGCPQTLRCVCGLFLLNVDKSRRRVWNSTVLPQRPAPPSRATTRKGLRSKEPDGHRGRSKVWKQTSQIFF